jgi:ABC-type transporter Mla subunit MlaD
MGKLGMKLSKAFSKIGEKTNKLTTKIGDKTNKIINTTKSIAAKLPEMNEKAIQLGNTIVDKSDKASNMLKKASGTLANVTGSLASIGGNVPLVGTALKAGAKATDLLAKGAKRLDSARDNAATKLNKYSDVSRETINDIEKQNQRKKIVAEEMQNSPDDGFA